MFEYFNYFCMLHVQQSLHIFELRRYLIQDSSWSLSTKGPKKTFMFSDGSYGSTYELRHRNNNIIRIILSSLKQSSSG